MFSVMFSKPFISGNPTKKKGARLMFSGRFFLFLGVFDPKSEINVYTYVFTCWKKGQKTTKNGEITRSRKRWKTDISDILGSPADQFYQVCSAPPSRRKSRNKPKKAWPAYCRLRYLIKHNNGYLSSPVLALMLFRAYHRRSCRLFTFYVKMY